MATVKGSRQHQMIVVPHRPWYRAWVFSLCVAALAALSWLTYRYGLNEGLEAKVGVLLERDALLVQLEQNDSSLAYTRQELADLKLGGEVDVLANEEVRQSFESLQTQIAELNEEIRFYKGVMVPNANEKGLRIEQFDITATDSPDRFRYGLRLTQVVEKHEYITGGVEISIAGKLGDKPVNYKLSDLNEEVVSPIKFRFRYFQNIEGEARMPEGFTPAEMLVAVRHSGQGAKGIEKTFEWRLKEE